MQSGRQDRSIISLARRVNITLRDWPQVAAREELAITPVERASMHSARFPPEWLLERVRPAGGRDVDAPVFQYWE